MSFFRIPAVTVTAGILASCTPREDPGITEKIALLEAELRSRDEQLSAMQEEIASASKSSSSDSAQSSAPDLNAARNSYLAFVETLRASLAEGMPGTKFDRTSVFPVEGPDPSKPIFSRVAFRIVSQDGRSGEIVVPLSASPSGEWLQPQTSEIVANFKAKLSAPPVAANTPAPAPAPPKQSIPTDVMGASRTEIIDWNDGNKQAPQPAAQQPAAPQPPPQPQAPALPKKVMPTSRDVIIDFE